MLKISIRLPYAGGGRTLPCTRNFFEKKLSKSFIPAAAGGLVQICLYLRAAPPAKRTADGDQRLRHIFFMHTNYKGHERLK